jgi:OmpA-OmpF porin, OOP family
MKELILAAVANALLFTADAQNIVPNPWFENYITCPTATTSPTHSLAVRDWFLPTKGTSDYFNICNNAINGAVGVSANGFGKQVAASGAGYTGIIVYDIQSVDYKEYLSCKLTSPMQPGVQYSVSMKVSLAESYSTSGCSALAVWFSKDTLPSVFKTSVATLSFPPKVSYQQFGMIKDTLNWVALKDTFQADSGYQYMIIGASVPKNNMVTERIRPSNFLERIYYYIDNVVVAPLGTEPDEPEPTAVKDVSEPRLMISPNPVTKSAVFKLTNTPSKPFSVSLINVMGQTVWTLTSAGGEDVFFERGSLPAGIYSYQVSVKGDVVVRGKLVLE